MAELKWKWDIEQKVVKNGQWLPTGAEFTVSVAWPDSIS